MRLWGQTDKHPLWGQTNPHTKVGDRLWYHLLRPAPNHVDIVRFGPKEALTALKRVYLVKRSLYIYSVGNILSYPMYERKLINNIEINYWNKV